MLLLKHNNCLVHMENELFCYRYPGSCLSEKSINSPMQHLQNIIFFLSLLSSKNDLPKIIDFKTHKQIK